MVRLTSGREISLVELVELTLEFVLGSLLGSWSSLFETLCFLAGLSLLLLLLRLFTKVSGRGIPDIRPLLQDSLDQLLLHLGGLGLSRYHLAQDTGQTLFAASKHRR